MLQVFNCKLFSFAVESLKGKLQKKEREVESKKQELVSDFKKRFRIAFMQTANVRFVFMFS